MESDHPAPIAFLFSGQGTQYPNMGKALYESQPEFRDMVNRCATILQPHLDTSLLHILYPTDSSQSPIAETRYAQPALFVVGYALAQLWAERGVVASFVAGHSLGELIAACFAGVLRLEDALPLVTLRGKLMQDCTAPGRMAVLVASLEQVHDLIAPYPDELSVAAINGPRQIVISGSRERITAILYHCEELFIVAQLLDVSVAIHSPLMEPILAPFKAAADCITHSPAHIPLVSAVRGEPIGSNEILDSAYWCSQIRQPVRFMEVVQSLAAQQVRVFLEIGAGNTLTTLGKRCLPKSYEATWLTSINRHETDAQTFAATWHSFKTVNASLSQ